MAKKRKASRKSEPTGPREVDAKDARLTVRDYHDVANSEDEYYAEKDRIDFDSDDDGERQSKRRRRQEKEDEFLEASDEEVFEEEDSDEEEEEKVKPKKEKKAMAAASDEEEEEEEQQGEEEGDEGWWGSSKTEYYDADQIETETDALEEEAEARRLQAKKLAKMEEADFAFDEGDWLAPKEQKGEEEEEVVTEVLRDVEVTEEMGPQERYKLLQTRYPEFDYLVDEFRDLRPLLETLQKEAEGKPAKSLEVIKSWVLGCYVASLASYFAILTSPARDGTEATKPLNPAELRDHEVMETLMSCREAWLKVQPLKPTKSAISDAGMLSPPAEEDEDEDVDMSDAPPDKKLKKEKKADIKARKKKEAEKARKAKAVEQSLADLSTLLKSTKPTKAGLASSGAADDRMDDNRSDFGEEDVIDARTADEKMRRKKSLKFYTSQIVQKASRRAGAGRDAGGDMDIPYRERLRDRQARLNAEAERRGKKDSKLGEALDGDGDDDAAVANEVRDNEDEYYDMVAGLAQKKKADKAARFEAITAARRDERVVEETELGADGKRQITYQIQKNKGLAPRRKKEVRNPRVKKRMKFEEKQKKLKSVKAVYKGGEGKGGYQGELSGIKTGLVKSVKL
ncbi:Sas10 C-terminal domain-containing protein [Immersiella caudata]|uniref:Sas10 C-terminal domain-containing protein n=1 Tax=Immersiella caudata TaxID=314043 RepID=A0AA40C2H5_9PEZI|nr:Sas10 C-terminal domain-containing protein [Immersiella caudata]